MIERATLSGWRQEDEMTDRKPNPESDAARSDEKQADENRELLKRKAEENLRDADSTQPMDRA